jgi:hypothetical protein
LRFFFAVLFGCSFGRGLLMTSDKEPAWIEDPDRISFHIPKSIVRRIGSVVIAFSKFEHTAELLIWHLLNVDGDRGKTITGRMETSRKTQLLKELLTIEAFADPFWDRFWESVRTTTEDRNKVVHGVWLTYRGIPALLSTRWKTQPNALAIESFSNEQLEELAGLSEKLDFTLGTWSERLGVQTAKYFQQSGGGRPTRR